MCHDPLDVPTSFHWHIFLKYTMWNKMERIPILPPYLWKTSISHLMPNIFINSKGVYIILSHLLRFLASTEFSSVISCECLLSFTPYWFQHGILPTNIPKTPNLIKSNHTITVIIHLHWSFSDNMREEGIPYHSTA